MISLYDLLKASRGQLLGPPLTQIFEDFCWDVRGAFSENRLFVALEAEYGDTHNLIPEAVASGAAGVLCSRQPDCDISGVPVILVQDTIEALYAWCHFLVGRLGVKVITVVGELVEPTALDAICRVLQVRGETHCCMDRLPPVLKIPHAAAHLRPEHTFMVIGLDPTHSGLLTHAVEALQPDVSVVLDSDSVMTNRVTGAGQFEHVMRVVENLSPGGLAVLNYDDGRVHLLQEAARAQVITIGVQRFGADLMAYDLTIDRLGLRFDVRHGQDRYADLQFDLLGEHHAYTILSAVAVGQYYGIAVQSSLDELSQLESAPGNLEPAEGPNGSLIVDNSYSAGTESILPALDWLRRLGESELTGRRLLVLGDWYTDSRLASRIVNEVGRNAEATIDCLLTIGTQGAWLAHQLITQGVAATLIGITYTLDDALQLIEKEFQPRSDDVIIVHGHSDSQLDRLVAALTARSSPDFTPARNITVIGRGRLNWLEFDYAALANNVRLLQANLADHVQLMAVVKADAYGHGAVASAWTALNNGAAWVGASSVQEAIELRSYGIRVPILTMNVSNSESILEAVKNNLSTTVFDLQLAKAYNRFALSVGRKLRVHIKVDSGMGRLGILPEALPEFFRQITALPGLEIEGIYTHFSTADEDPEYAAEQLRIFQNGVRLIQTSMGIKIPLIHAANSAASLTQPETHLNMVRTGISMYGLAPAPDLPLPPGFQPVMTWKSSIAQVKVLPEGHPVSYGNTYVTKQPERIAIVPVGYGDGFRRGPRHWGHVLVRGQRAPILGRVSMEKTVISVDHIPDVLVGDEVVLLGRQGDQQITAEEIAEQLGTINYEVTTNILPRLSRLMT
jgi:Alr-MurF fusion protein